MYTPETLEGVGQLDCKDPAKDMIAKAVADDFSANLDRFLKALKVKKPGHGSEQVVSGAVSQANAILQAMADASEKDMPTISAPGRARLVREIGSAMADYDKASLAALDGLAKKSNLGNFPTQALPMSPQDLCALKRR
jgi:hypothetical protein